MDGPAGLQQGRGIESPWLDDTVIYTGQYKRSLSALQLPCAASRPRADEPPVGGARPALFIIKGINAQFDLFDSK